MSGLFRPAAQDSVFTLGDEDIEEIDLGHEGASGKGTNAPSIMLAADEQKDDASLPVSSTAGATQGLKSGSNGAEISASEGAKDVHTKGPGAAEKTEHSAAATGIDTSGNGKTLNAALASQSATSQQQHFQDRNGASVAAEEQRAFHLAAKEDAQQNGSAAHTSIPAVDEGRHLNEDEEQKIAEELAALEAEAEAQALEEQHRRSAPSPPRSNTPSRGGDHISLNDGASQAERAMAEAERAAQQATAGTSAMQSALDGFEPRKRPFSPPPGSAPLQRFSPTAEYIEPPEFQGLLFFDGLDTLGRPVVVVNADALGDDRGARKSAFQHIVNVLEPIVIQGPYVLLLVSLAGGTRSNKIQTGLLVSAYRGLSRPFRKNVKYIILVRPSKPLKTLLSFLKPFVSRKAHRKVLKIESLSAVAEATNNEVTLSSLGSRFTAAAAQLM